mgnify:CR=1 FL=1
MIKETELRIGNIVLDHYTNMIRPITIEDFVRQGTERPKAFEYFQEVPITTGTLLSFGCRVRHKFLFDVEIARHKILFIHLDRAEGRDGNKWLIKMYDINAAPIAALEFVHQFQNLYFALSGNELISKNGLSVDEVWIDEAIKLDL